MKAFKTEPTFSTPKIVLDKNSNTFVFSGRSLPENSDRFFTPVLEWFKEYSKNPNHETEIVFKLDYFNTSTVQRFYQLFEILKEMTEKSKVTIMWYYPDEDVNLLDSGKDFAHVTGLNFKFISYPYDMF
ncbi:MAG: DUF1987 domain-containing protein [Bacteroidota bacterium]